jgi:hypothetical protein
MKQDSFFPFFLSAASKCLSSLDWTSYVVNDHHTAKSLELLLIASMIPVPRNTRVTIYMLNLLQKGLIQQFTLPLPYRSNTVLLPWLYSAVTVPLRSYCRILTLLNAQRGHREPALYVTFSSPKVVKTSTSLGPHLSPSRELE